MRISHPRRTYQWAELAQLARAFTEEIERWRLSSVTETSPVAIDSVEGGQLVVVTNQGTPPDDPE